MNQENRVIVGRESSGPIVLLARDIEGHEVTVPLTLEQARFVRDRLAEYVELARVTRSKELPIRRGSKRGGGR
jgi:hypothetical protein